MLNVQSQVRTQRTVKRRDLDPRTDVGHNSQQIGKRSRCHIEEPRAMQMPWLEANMDVLEEANTHDGQVHDFVHRCDRKREIYKQA